MSRHLLTSIFTSLARDTRRWTLLRILKSDNPLDIQGELRGTATFTSLPPRSDPSPHLPQPRDTNTSTNTTPTASNSNDTRDILYHEEGDMPAKLGVGLRWTKNYIWRLSDSGVISVWFVKVGSGADTEPDYLFHDFEFASTGSSSKADQDDDSDDATFVAAPEPPATLTPAATTVVTARGNHLCINDMYRTAYAFRVDEGSGEVVSWASRHVVKGPKKNQDIVNLYSVER